MRDREELTRETFAAFNRRDVDALIVAFAPDAEWWPLRSSTEGPYRGHEGIRAYLDDTAEMFEVLRVDLEEVYERDGVMLGFGRVHAKGRGSGAPVELVIAWVFRFAGDRVVWAKSFADRDEAIAESGLEPPRTDA